MTENPYPPPTPTEVSGLFSIPALDDWGKFEFDEGYKDGVENFNLGKEMPTTLNFPFHPYARGY